MTTPATVYVVTTDDDDASYVDVFATAEAARAAYPYARMRDEPAGLGLVYVIDAEPVQE